MMGLPMFNRWRRNRGLDDAEFWRLISLLDWKHEGNDEAVVEPVIAALAAKTDVEIAEFQEILARKLFALDGRAWFDECGSPAPSGDTFLYQRCVVVANGQAFYEKVLANPKAMPKELEFESLLYMSRQAAKIRSGNDDGHDTQVSYESFSNEAGWREKT